jgi:CO/xanthine dehydrogenase FAD-binding subunit
VAGAAVKPAPFSYEAPRSLDDALALVGEDSRPLAGGQSLVPLLNFRLARPERLVDLNRLESLDYLELERADRTLRIGALVRQAALERAELVRREWPLLHQAVRMVGHAATRTRGTVAGSAAHADPAAELPVALAALDASFHLRSLRGGRVLQAREFFLGPLTTALEPDELLVEISVPALPAGARTAFVEQARTQGDFATAGAAVVLAPGEHAAVALLGAASTPVRAAEAERSLLAGAGADEAAALAARSVRDDYRRALLAELVRRAIEAVL